MPQKKGVDATEKGDVCFRKGVEADKGWMPQKASEDDEREQSM